MRGEAFLVFFALNRALTFKWIWRFKTQDSMWARFIKSVYGDHGYIDHSSKSPRSFTWLDIVREVHHLKLQGIDLLAYCVKRWVMGFPLVSRTIFRWETCH